MKSQTMILLGQLKTKLESLRIPENKQVFIGFDGFVDSIQKAIRTSGDDGPTYYDTVTEFAERIRSAKGKNGQIEVQTVRTKLGGNAPILANALGGLGVKCFCFGSLGFPEKFEIFSDLDAKCKTASINDPGISNAIEFDDGRIILSDLKAFEQYTWLRIKEKFNLQKLRSVIEKSSVLAFVDWVNLPFSNEIWRGVRDDILKRVGRNDFVIFFDLCDPSKKTPAQIREVLDLISSFSAYGSVTLGLNENEATVIMRAVSDNAENVANMSITQIGQSIFNKMNIDKVLIHPRERTIVLTLGELIELPGHVVAKPKVLTGGGDNLNAGYLFGCMNNFSLKESILLGMAASGAYVLNGHSPKPEELVEYIGAWMDEKDLHLVL